MVLLNLNETIDIIIRISGLLIVKQSFSAADTFTF